MATIASKLNVNLSDILISFCCNCKLGSTISGVFYPFVLSAEANKDQAGEGYQAPQNQADEQNHG